jgi:hypothetical protein
MANNRLMIVDTEAGVYVTLAKGFGEGWELRPDSDMRLCLFLAGRDITASEIGPTTLRLITEYQLADLEAELGVVFKAFEN